MAIRGHARGDRKAGLCKIEQPAILSHSYPTPLTDTTGTGLCRHWLGNWRPRMLRKLRPLPVLVAIVALIDAGCGSKPAEHTPTAPRPPLSRSEGKVTAFAVAPGLGSAGSFGVLGSSTVTNTGPTTVNGDLGVSPGLACTGFPAPCTGGGPGTLTGIIHAGDATALAAQGSVTTAYNARAGQACNVDLTGTDLGGLTRTPGAYCF